jgi:hypothetical protein
MGAAHEDFCGRAGLIFEEEKVPRVLNKLLAFGTLRVARIRAHNLEPIAVCRGFPRGVVA